MNREAVTSDKESAMGDRALGCALALNVVIVLLVVLSITWMVGGFSQGVLSSAGLVALRYFTIDSNILMGVAALVGAVDEWRVLRGKKGGVSVATSIIKLVGTVGVALTMCVTVFYLTPSTAATLGPFAMFAGANLFLHLVIPLLAIACFVGFERTRAISFRHTFTAVVPLAVYAVYYVAQALAHSTGGIVDAGHDWYGFFFLGTQSVAVVLPLILLVTYAISFGLWKLNRR